MGKPRRDGWKEGPVCECGSADPFVSREVIADAGAGMGSLGVLPDGFYRCPRKDGLHKVEGA